MLSLKDKAAKVIEWAKGWSGFEDYLKLNAIVTLEGEAALVTNPVDRATTVYIDGTADRRFVFMMRLILPWSSGYDTVNQTSLEMAVDLYDWVAEQNEAKNYPNWEGARIDSVFPTKSYPELGYIYEEDQLAEYIVEVEIDFME